MTDHRDLNLERFITAVNFSNPKLVERYLAKFLDQEKMPRHLSAIHYDCLKAILSEFDEEAHQLVMEDFRSLNDICEQTARAVYWASEKFSIKTEPDETPEALALRLFLDYPQAFQSAIAFYSVKKSSKTVSWHRMPCPEFHFDEAKRVAFEISLREYFDSASKGKNCQVYYYADEFQPMIVVHRGSYYKTISYWLKDKLESNPIRPAYQDILLYDRKNGRLCIQTHTAGDMDKFIDLFAEAIGNPELAKSPDRDNLYTLEPIEKKTFNWDGNEFISAIIPLEAKLKLAGPSEAVMTIRSKNLMQTLDNELGKPALSAVKLIHIKLRFILDIDGKKEKVTFLIRPPFTTDLIKKKHEKIISEYLLENGIQCCA